MQISSNVAFVLVDEVKQLERLELETNTDVVGDPNENIEQVLNVTNTPSVSTDRTIIKIWVNKLKLVWSIYILFRKALTFL